METPNNPYAPSISILDGPQFDNLPPEHRLYACYVGPRAKYYLKCWEFKIGFAIWKSSFNLAAFLFPGFWFAYRKMYKIALVFGVFTLLQLIVEQLFCELVLGIPETSALWDLVSVLGISAFLGYYANYWYFNHVKRAIEEEQSSGLSGSELERRLSIRGGTNVWAGIGSLVAMLVTGTLAAVCIQQIFHPDWPLF